MAKRVTEQNDSGQVVGYALTRARRKSTERQIPWTPGPKTRAQKIARNLWG